MKTRIIILLASLFFLAPLITGAQPTPTPPPMSMQGQDQQRISVLEWEHKAHMASRELMKFQLREAERMNAKADIEAIQAEYARAGERMAKIQEEYKRITEVQKMREQAEKAEKVEKVEKAKKSDSPATTSPVAPADMPPIPTQTEGAH